jgi:hypothetical protein
VIGVVIAIVCTLALYVLPIVRASRKLQRATETVRMLRRSAMQTEVKHNITLDALRITEGSMYECMGKLEASNRRNGRLEEAIIKHRRDYKQSKRGHFVYDMDIELWAALKGDRA